MKRRLAFTAWLLSSAVFAAAPELPRILMDTTYRTPSGTTTAVNSGGNLQTAINNASCGDILSLEAGATFTGNFTLPDKDCASGDYVVIRTATPDGTFPRPGNRVGPSHAGLMSKLTVGSGAIITSDSDADHYRLIGLEITPSAYLNALIDLSGGQGDLSTQTNNIIIDRCYVHGHATTGSRRGVSAQGAYIAVIDSYLSDFKEVGADTQAIASWNGSGPLKIVNNYLEAASENVMFGGANSASDSFMPRDIEIRRNLFSKPLAWKADDPSWDSSNWDIKNLFEIKSAQRVLVEGNLFQRNWNDGQAGTAIVFTPRGETSSPWHTIQDVIFRGNAIAGASGGINIMSEDNSAVSVPAARITISHNLLTDIDRSNWSGGDAFAFQHLGGDEASTDVVITNNTIIKAETAYKVLSLAGLANGAVSAVFTENIISHDEYGIIGDGYGTGDAGINYYMDQESITENVLYGNSGASSSYTGHSGNFFPADETAVGFENYAGGDYRLDVASDYYADATGGADKGAWVPAATAAASQLDWNLEWQDGYTAVAITFGAPGLPYNQSCDVRVGSSVTTSATGPSRRTVVVTGLTPASEYFIGVDCGTTWGGALSYTNFTAASVPGGNRTVPISIGDPANASVTRCTVEYDDNSSLSSPTSVQDTTCSTGGSVNLTVPAGITYWRVKLQDNGDTVLATGTVQPLAVQ